ncbi:MAG: hypothetical protein JWO38_5811 [Gemmataceae bacterium]|nr:hypothetical protein [Gemmataceae bacterium]
MSKKNHCAGPVPPGNQSHAGASYEVPGRDESGKTAAPQSGQEEDPKRRLGDYTGTGEHSRQQPGPLNDGGRRHGEDVR